MKKFKVQKLIINVSVLLFISVQIVQAQNLSEAEAVALALKNNQLIKSAEFKVAHYKQLIKAGADIGKFSAVWMRGQYNTIETDNNISLTQSIPFPGTMAAQVRLGEEYVVGSDKNLLAAKNNLAFDVKTAYETLLYQKAYHALLLSQDTLFTDFAKASSVRYKTGESNLLEMTTAETQLMDVKNLITQNEADIFIAKKKLQALLKEDIPVDASSSLFKRGFNTGSVLQNPQLQLSQQQITISAREKKLEQSRLVPDFTIGYFNQTLIGYQNTQGTDRYFGKTNRFDGFTVGLNFPLWFAPQVARIKAASLLEESNRQSAEYLSTALSHEYEQALREVKKNDASLDYYLNSALKNADLILTQARKAFKGGEIGYLEYLQSLRNSISLKENYLMALHQYNLSVIKTEHLTGTY